MKNRLGTQPVNGEKVRMGYVIATLLNIIGGSSNNVKDEEIDKEVEKIRASEDKGVIENLEKRILQTYKEGKGKSNKKLVQEYKEGKVKVERGPKIKNAEMRIQEESEMKTNQKDSKEREER